MLWPLTPILVPILQEGQPAQAASLSADVAEAAGHRRCADPAVFGARDAEIVGSVLAAGDRGGAGGLRRGDRPFPTMS